MLQNSQRDMPFLLSPESSQLESEILEMPGIAIDLTFFELFVDLREGKDPHVNNDMALDHSNRHVRRHGYNYMYHPTDPNPAVATRSVFPKSKPSKKYFRFDKKVCVGRTLNSDHLLALNFGESLREFEETKGKYRILDGRSVECKGNRHAT